MIWALLFALIFGGSESALMNPEFKKHVRRHVEDKDRKHNILDLVKVYEKEAKSLRKRENKQIKKMNALNSSRLTTNEEFEAFFKKQMNDKRALSNKRIVLRLSVQSQIEQTEWDLILIDSKKAWEKDDKKREKYINKINKSFKKVDTRILGNVIDEERKHKALNIVENFRKDLIRLQKAYNGLNVSENLVYQNNEASELELQLIQDEINHMKWELYNSYIQAHMELVNVVSEDEWPKIIKSINKIF